MGGWVGHQILYIVLFSGGSFQDYLTCALLRLDPNLPPAAQEGEHGSVWLCCSCGLHPDIHVLRKPIKRPELWNAVLASLGEEDRDPSSDESETALDQHASPRARDGTRGARVSAGKGFMSVCFRWRVPSPPGGSQGLGTGSIFLFENAFKRLDFVPS